ncbi:MAG: hypothetical protein ACTSUB_04980 [Candidatus Thorarchaeota archaeon]
MVNAEKSLKRDRTRLRRGQNPQQIDFKRMRKVRNVGRKYWLLRKKPESASEMHEEGKKGTKKEKPKKKEPELEVIDAELEEIYSIDDDEDLEDEPVKDDENPE